MEKFYFLIWAIIAVYLFAIAKKTSKLCYVLADFFLFMSVWYGVDSFSEIDMFSGPLGITFRCLVAAYLVALIIAYIIIKKKK